MIVQLYDSDGVEWYREHYDGNTYMLESRVCSDGLYDSSVIVVKDSIRLYILANDILNAGKALPIDAVAS